MSGKHTFSLFSAEALGDLKPDQKISVRNDELYRRVYKVLRLNQEDTIVLFDGSQQLTMLLTNSNKKGFLEGMVKEVSVSRQLTPCINLYVGLTKKDAFKEVVYFAAQMGAASITPLLTEKNQRRWGGDKEKEKLEKIMISACEQAKQFIIPALCAPIVLKEVVTKIDGIKLFFEAHGQPLLPFIQKNSRNSQSISVFIGPEGGFTQSEQGTLEQSGGNCYRLTPTILRSQEAVVVSLGVLRTLL